MDRASNLKPCPIILVGIEPTRISCETTLKWQSSAYTNSAIR